MRKIFTVKRIIWTIILVGIVALIGWRVVVARQKAAAGNIQTTTVTRQNLKETVLTTGQVVSGLDLDLSFQTTGVVDQVFVKEGDTVKAGETLAVLDESNAKAALTSAQGTLAEAKANYQKVLAGSSSEAITVAEKAVEAAQVALDNAQTNLAVSKSQQKTAVQNAYQALLNTPFTAVASPGNIDDTVATISGSYSGTTPGKYFISIFNASSGPQVRFTGLENGSAAVNSQVAVPLGTKGLYIDFSGSPSLSDSWTVTIPNIYSSSYVTNNNAYLAALQTETSTLATATAAVNSAEVALAQAEANLAVEKAAPRSADIAAAEAQILTAEGQVASAQVALDHSELKAPANGTITAVDTKVGEQATALQEVMILQDVEDLHAEAEVSEANIASLKVGQPVDYTFDAFGPDEHFNGSVLTINPASTVISGVVDYKVTADFKNIPNLKPGMTANMTILVAEKNNVLAVPASAIISHDNANYVRIITDPSKNTYKEVPVQTGLEADGGLVEIMDGLSEGQEIVSYIKS